MDNLRIRKRAFFPNEFRLLFTLDSEVTNSALQIHIRMIQAGRDGQHLLKGIDN